MRFFDGAAVDGALGYPGLVDILQTAFKQGAISPLRHHHPIALDGRPEAMLLLMPAWEASASGAATAGRYLGVKTVTVFPDNAARGKPAVFGTYLLLSAETGETLAVMDATRLTAWRTGAASALASRYLSRPDASRLLMVGAGALAPHLVAAHASARPIREVVIWNRSAERARTLAATLTARGLAVSIADDLEAAVRRADIVSVATLSAEPLIRGDWLSPGTHVDCVGAYRPNMRETDDAVVRRARIFVDSRTGAFAEAGDIVQPLQAGVIGKEAILGDLFDLTRGTVSGRQTPKEITFFKSVGAAIEDLAAAIAVYDKGRKGQS
jgi:ornithine cyclodeaminase/alanine dehydrogenase-like protein (mu-crystallin family)